jgi:hypothetical protein
MNVTSLYYVNQSRCDILPRTNILLTTFLAFAVLLCYYAPFPLYKVESLML